MKLGCDLSQSMGAVEALNDRSRSGFEEEVTMRRFFLEYELRAVAVEQAGFEPGFQAVQRGHTGAIGIFRPKFQTAPRTNSGKIIFVGWADKELAHRLEANRATIKRWQRVAGSNSRLKLS